MTQMLEITVTEKETTSGATEIASYTEYIYCCLRKKNDHFINTIYYCGHNLTPDFFEIYLTELDSLTLFYQHVLNHKRKYESGV